MTLLEAIHNCGENWFRPVADGFEGRSYSVIDGAIWYHWAEGFSEVMAPCWVNFILGDWEIVTPEKVRGERG